MFLDEIYMHLIPSLKGPTYQLLICMALFGRHCVTLVVEEEEK